MEERNLESLLEGILFTAGEPMESARLREVLEVSQPELEAAAAALADYYRLERRGIRLVKLDDAWQLVSAPEYAVEIRRAMERRKPPRLSAPMLEVLAIIAYFQPTTRGYIEQVRGVSSGHSVNGLLERGLIEECGRLSAPGRPALFRTTKHFLQTFALSSLDELPGLPERGEAEELDERERKKESKQPGKLDGVIAPKQSKQPEKPDGSIAPEQTKEPEKPDESKASNRLKESKQTEQPDGSIAPEQTKESEKTAESKASNRLKESEQPKEPKQPNRREEQP